MQRERESQSRNNHSEMSDPFGNFQGFGNFNSHRSMLPGLFGRWNPFDDPFFSRPFRETFEPSSFGQSSFSVNKMQTNGNIPPGIVIEELPSDDEGDREEYESAQVQKDSSRDNVGSNKEPHVDEQSDDDDTGEEKTCIHTQQRASSFSFSKVTYGGINGAYYTSQKTRTAGDGGVVVEESKEADKTTGQATHRISRGIHDKGHSVTRKLNSDGKVDTMQTLHNLNEDELTGFEKAWEGTGKGQILHSNDGFGMYRNSGPYNGEPRGWGGWSLPLVNRGPHTQDNEFRSTASGSRRKNVVRINIE